MSQERGSERIFVFAPRGRDAELTRVLLVSNGLDTEICTSGVALISAIRAGAGCAVVTQEALGAELQTELATIFGAQPPWSDFPLVILSGGHHPLQPELGNVTVLERPVSPATLLTAVTASLRARRRQYQARAAIQQRDQFLAMLGHELRNPLGAIVLATEMVRSGSVDREKVASRLEMISRQAGHLARLVDDLLDVSRVTSGRLQLRREAVDVDEIVQSCIGALAARAAERQVTLHVEARCGAVIEGDAVRIEQVISNLLTNAIKYSSSGRTVSISSRCGNHQWELRIRDQGIGIAADMLPRVFDLFAQADGSLERSEGGMGIGLTLVDRLVRLHDGTVEVTSEGLGKGSEFIVRIPIGHAPGKPAAVEEPAPSGLAVHVVLVEDNEDLRELSEALLQSLGCEVTAAADGPHGLERILAEKPDLAVIDIGLPGMDGFAVARQVRARLGDSLLLVAVTGYGQAHDREHALAAGFDVHITKPMRTPAIKTMVERARTAVRGRRLSVVR
ncbi:MAG: histidine kinase [Myxococcales bacterium]|nr:histidine kinase [Myxococcales bacterium]